jgi:DNA replication and repair protein RecF
MIKKLSLLNFRNYRNQTISFDSGINILVGENGQGKTNLLEAVYFLAFLRSFRTSSIQSIKQIGSKGFYLASELHCLNKWNRLLEIEYLSKRRLKIDNLPVFKSSEFIRHIRPVVFSSDDIKLISDSSGIRRKSVDILLSASDKNYLLILQKYITALRSRNAALRDDKIDISVISAFEPLLAEFALEIINSRHRVLENISNKADKILKTIKGDNYSFNIKYISKLYSKNMSFDNILENIILERERDIRRGYSGLGPHSDDIEFIFNNKNLKNFGSLGQCRLAVLCIKMAEIELLLENDNEKNVVVLIDDVTGELDTRTKDSFFETVSKVKQLFFTFTKFNKSESYFNDAAVHKISDGKIL